ncbi:DUF2807 domain-containing protein [Hymenobacter gummosus]|uniref:DUF2807 domain-containing protein n=1 Tax=Hymenobacter gummosus TaxID=1776032 RepID=A0A431U8U5_9BACT|nr:head GIN domain-containing protein [Hymenobacter gummosus]RTQ53673.1 DUF2807 domain-containing protein [Hymenobacter gummosus]
MKTTLLPRLALPLLLAVLPILGPATAAPVVAAVPVADAREVRNVAAFSKLTLATSAEVILEQGSTQKVELEGLPEDLKEIETTVDGGKLRIGTVSKTGLNWRGLTGRVRVYVTMTKVEALSVSGSGSIQAAKELRGGTMTVAVSGSGRLQAPLAAESVEASISGSGGLRLSGSTKALSTHISGSGSIQATELQAATCEAHISGSGNCRVNVSQTLDAHISGSGSVHYAGSPKVTSRIAGSGRVSKG